MNDKQCEHWTKINLRNFWSKVVELWPQILASTGSRNFRTPKTESKFRNRNFIAKNWSTEESFKVGLSIKFIWITKLYLHLTQVALREFQETNVWSPPERKRKKKKERKIYNRIYNLTGSHSRVVSRNFRLSEKNLREEKAWDSDVNR